MQNGQGKSLLLIWLALSLFTSTLIASNTVSAQTTPTVQAPIVLDTGLVSDGNPDTAEFSIDVTIANVEDMNAFDFRVYYNTSVLTGVGGEGYYPFTYPLPTKINDTEGSILVGASLPPPVPPGSGFYTVDPYPVMRVDFSVDALGATTLDIRKPVFANTAGEEMPLIVLDGYFSNIYSDISEVPHDIAVTDIQASPTRDVMPGESVSINVTVANQAPHDETFTLTTRANSITIDSQSVSLIALTETTVQIQWDTTGVDLGHYTISADASVVTGETDTADNTHTFSDVVVLGIHDVAVTKVVASPMSAVLDDFVSINATVSNLGNFTETFHVTARYGYVIDTPQTVQPPVTIETKPVSSLVAGTSTTVTFTWNTSDVVFYSGKTVAYLWIEANVSATLKPAVDYETSQHTVNNMQRMTGNVTLFLAGPLPSFTISTLTGSVPLEGQVVIFDASLSTGTIVSYKWDFGDGNVTTVSAKDIKHSYTANGTYSVRLTVTDDKGASRSKTKTLTVFRRDVAVLSVSLSKTEVPVGESTIISVVVRNQGDYGQESFNVTVYYDSTAVQMKAVTALGMGESKTVSFSWSVTGVSAGTYTVSAEATDVPGESNTANNRLVSDSALKIVTHNVAVTGATLSSNEVFIGDVVTIRATVKNKGNFTETFTVTVYYGNTQIDSKSVSSLAAGASQIVLFDWNTTGVDAGTYTIKVVAATVTDETEKTDNTYSSGTVNVKTPEEQPQPQQKGIPIEYLVAAGIAAVAVIAIAVYALRMRKPK